MVLYIWNVKKMKNISFVIILLSVLSLFMHSFVPHHHHDSEECEMFDINGISSTHLHSDFSDSHIHSGLNLFDDDHEDSDSDSDHHAYLNCHFHSDITVFSVFTINFLLPEGIRIITFQEENETEYLVFPQLYNFSLEEEHFRRGPPAYFMG
jgi:hypothetical protein